MNLTGKILIVDDDTMTLDFFDIMLSKLGFQVIKSEDGFDAMEKISLFNPDLILLDNKLPKMTGLEVTERIRKSNKFNAYKNIPIIMFSALDDVQSKVEGLEAGVDDYITKPFNFTEVLARIRAILRHKVLSNRLIKREKRLAILESLKTNFLAFTKYIKKPLADLYGNAKKLNYSNENQIKSFIRNFQGKYVEMLALLQGLEDEIIDFEKKKDDYKKPGLTIEELEKKISNHLKKIDKTKK